MFSTEVVVAEWLRRWTRNPLGFPRAGSNPADYGAFIFKYLHFEISCVGKRIKVDYATSFFTSAVIVILIYARVSGAHNKNHGSLMA